MLLQLADGSQRIYRVSGETGNRLGDDQIALSGQRILDHAIEALTLLCAGACDTLVGIYVHELPMVGVFLGLYVFCVVFYLRLIACQLLLAVGGNKGVGCYSLVTDCKCRHTRHCLQARWDHRYRLNPSNGSLVSSDFAHCAVCSLLRLRCSFVFSAAFLRFSASQLSFRE